MPHVDRPQVTHYFGDGCKEHTSPLNQLLDKTGEMFEMKWFAKNGELKVETFLDIKQFIRTAQFQAVQAFAEEVKKDFLAIADAGELEDLRREVEAYFNKPL